MAALLLLILLPALGWELSRAQEVVQLLIYFSFVPKQSVPSVFVVSSVSLSLARSLASLSLSLSLPVTLPAKRN